MAHLTDEQADKVFSILVQFGMSESSRRDFCLYVREGTPGNKVYPFKGPFGRGGKVTVSNSAVAVNYFQKDCNPERLALCAELNELLKEFSPISGYSSPVMSAKVDKR